MIARRAALLFAAVTSLAGCGAAKDPAQAGLERVAPPAPAPDTSAPTVPMVPRWRFAMRHMELFTYAPMESSSPVVAGDRVYAASARGAALYALDADSGASIWSYRTRGRVESTVALGGGRVYVADAKGRLHGVNEADGKPAWRVELGGLPTARVLYHASGVERVLVATNDNRVHARNAINGAELWTYRREAPADLTIYGTSSPVLVATGAGEVYVVGFSDGTLVALKPANGTVVWETRLVSQGRFRDVDGTVLQMGDRLYVTAYGDELHALDAATGRTLWSIAPGGATGIAAGDGRLYHGVDSGEVIARDPADGRELWRWKMPGGVPTTPVLGGDLVFVASSSKTLYALRAGNGSLAWTYDPGWNVSGSWAAPAVGGSRVYFTSNVGTVYGFEPAGPDIHYIGSWDSDARERR